MYFIGIDPGREGAVAVIDGDTMSVHVFPLPQTTLHSKAVLDVERLHEMLSGYPAEKCKALVEHQHARVIIAPARSGKPARRVDTPVTAFSLGYSYGAIRSCLTCMKIGMVAVEPAKWKLEYSIGGGEQGKQDAISKARALYPGVQLRTDRARKDNDGFADALLMADYLLRKYNVSTIAQDVIDYEEM